MGTVKANRSFYYWDTDKTYRLGEVFDVDYLQEMELINEGVVDIFEEKEIVEEEVPAGTTIVEFLISTNEFKRGTLVEFDNERAYPLLKKGIVAPYCPVSAEPEVISEGTTTLEFLVTTNDFKCGQVVELDNEIAFSYLKNGTAVPYCPVSAVSEDVPPGRSTIEFQQTTKDFKCGQIVELDNEVAYPLLKAGIAKPAQQEDPLKIQIKKIKKMNKDELVAYATSNGIPVWKNEELQRAAIIRSLRGEN